MKHRTKTTSGEKRRLSALPETAEDCANWLELAVKKRRVTSTSLYKLATDFLPERDIPTTITTQQLSQKKKHGKELLTRTTKSSHKKSDDKTEQMDEMAGLLTSRIVDWGQKTRNEWCADIQRLYQLDPVALRVQKMNQECQHQFKQLKQIYDILSVVPSLKVLQIYDIQSVIDGLRILQPKLVCSDPALVARLLAKPDETINPFVLGQLKKEMKVHVAVTGDAMVATITLSLSGQRTGSVCFNQFDLQFWNGEPLPDISLTANEILQADWERTLLTHPGVLQTALDLIAQPLSDIKGLAHITSQYLLPLNLYTQNQGPFRGVDVRNPGRCWFS
jgi:hypothetical protein